MSPDRSDPDEHSRRFWRRMVVWAYVLVIMLAALGAWSVQRQADRANHKLDQQTEQFCAFVELTVERQSNPTPPAAGASQSAIDTYQINVKRAEKFMADAEAIKARFPNPC